MEQVILFISTVTDEFRAYRDELTNTLRRPNVSVKVQEDFIASGDTTLLKLDDYIQRCDAIIHLVGDATGGLAREPALVGLRRRYSDWPRQQAGLAAVLDGSVGLCSYTQWEAYLAIFHHKTLLICVPEVGAPREPGFAPQQAQRGLQDSHLARLRQCGRYAEITFANCDKLIIHLQRSTLQGLLPPVSVPVNLPPSLGSLFKGRQEFLAKIRAAFHPVGPASKPATRVAIHGLGGIGKTQVAAEYGHIFAGSYCALLAVSANDPAALQASVADLTGCLRLSEQTDSREEARYDAALKWLEDHPGWFLLIDNVDTEEVFREVDKLIRRLVRGHILITSRIRDWPLYVRDLELTVLSPEHSTEYLLEATAEKRTSRGEERDRADAVVLAKELDNLALALTQAAAYIRVNSPMSLADYLAEWKLNKPALLEDPDFDPVRTGYPRSVAVTWVTTVQQLAPEARFLLEVLCWLAADPIPDRLLKNPWPCEALEYAPKAIHARLIGKSARNALLRYSMLTAQPSSPGRLLIHRLVQEVGRLEQKRASTADRRACCAVQWVAADFVRSKTSEDLRDNLLAEVRPLMPHVRELLGHQIGRPSFNVQLARAQLCQTLAGFHNAQGLYAEAEEAAIRAVAEIQGLTKVPQADTRVSRLCLARSYLELSVNYYQRSYHAKSLESAREATLVTQDLRAEHPEDSEILHAHLVSLRRLGQAFLDLGRVEEASISHEEGLLVARYLQKDPESLTCKRDLSLALHCVGNLREAQGKGEQALAAGEEALGMSRAMLNRDPGNLRYQRDLSILLYYVARWRDAQGDWVQALVASEEALELDRGRLDRDPANLNYQLDLGGTLYQIGNLRADQGEREQALAAFEESLSLARALLGQEPANLTYQRSASVAVDGIGRLREAQGEREQALAAYEESLSLARGVLDREPANLTFQRDLSLALARIGNLRAEQGEREQALAAFEESLSLARALLDREPANLTYQRSASVAVDGIGRLREAQGEREQALAAYEESLSLARGVLDREPANLTFQRDLSLALARIGNLRAEQGEREQALAAFEESLSLARALLDREPANLTFQRDLSLALARIGNLRAEQGEREQALAAFEESLILARALLDQEPTNLTYQGDVSFTLERIEKLREASA